MAPNQFVTLAAGAFAGLSSGTNYAISAYAPQLASRLFLTVTQLNVVSTAANLGMYLTGSVGGPIIDKRGPRVGLLISATAMLCGWTLVWAFYHGGPEGIFAKFGVPGLAFAQFLTGVGSSTGTGSAVNGVARSFGLRRRSTALSVIFCCTGLSAFVYSSSSRLLFHSNPDPTSSFLLLLAFGTTTSMLVGAVWVRPALFPTGHPGPLAKTTDTQHIAISTSEEPSAPVSEARSETQPLLGPRPVAKPAHVNVRGWTLLGMLDFHILFALEGLMGGVGLMWLNNLGTILNTLWLTTPMPPTRIPTAQANLVSIFSLCNALGRIVVGTSSDYLSHHAPRAYRLERVWFCLPVASLFVLAMTFASRTTLVFGWHGLGPPTALTGFAYGMLWGLMPVLCLDWFGLKSYSSNNGLLVLSPAIYGQITNFAFGHIYDSHTSYPTSGLVVGGAPVKVLALCTKGKECYKGALHLGIGMAVGAMGLAIVAGLRRGGKAGWSDGVVESAEAEAEQGP